MKTSFRVWPVDMKPREYNDLAGIKNDFNQEELVGACFVVCYGAVTVGNLNAEKVLEEVYT